MRKYGRLGARRPSGKAGGESPCVLSGLEREGTHDGGCPNPRLGLKCDNEGHFCDRQAQGAPEKRRSQAGWRPFPSRTGAPRRASSPQELGVLERGRSCQSGWGNPREASWSRAWADSLAYTEWAILRGRARQDGPTHRISDSSAGCGDAPRQPCQPLAKPPPLPHLPSTPTGHPHARTARPAPVRPGGPLPPRP